MHLNTGSCKLESTTVDILIILVTGGFLCNAHEKAGPERHPFSMETVDQSPSRQSGRPHPLLWCPILELDLDCNNLHLPIIIHFTRSYQNKRAGTRRPLTHPLPRHLARQADGHVEVAFVKHAHDVGAIRAACNRGGNILEIIQKFVLVKVAGDFLPMLMIWPEVEENSEDCGSEGGGGTGDRYIVEGVGWMFGDRRSWKHRGDRGQVWMTRNGFQSDSDRRP